MSTAIRHMNSAIEILDMVLDEESFAMDNYPENLQSTDIYFEMENAVDVLTSAIDSAEDSREELESIV